jgi:hypothetical protein
MGLLVATPTQGDEVFWVVGAALASENDVVDLVGGFSAASTFEAVTFDDSRS